MQLTASDPQYAFAPIMGGQPARFAGGGTATADPNWQPGQYIDPRPDEIGSGLRGLIASLAAKNKFGMEPRYTYDPTAQTYSLVGGGPGAQPTSLAAATAPAPRYTYNPQDQTYTPMAQGGLAAAQQTQSKGRGEDTMLVHMAPSEVRGLQALAMAHGGSLTINPQTGLPEAGFLKSLLPMLIGGALTVVSGGALTPLMAAGIVGGGTALATGSLKKGLMAGLGAYGGAGLGAGLTAAGATTVEGAAATEAAKQAAGRQLAEEAAKNAALEGITLPANYAELAASTATPAQVAAQQTMAQHAAMAGRGFEGLTSEAGRKAFMAAAPTGTLSTAGMAVASGLTPEAPKAGTKPETYIRSYDYAWNPNQEAYATTPSIKDTSERRYFTPTYTAKKIEKAPADTVSYGYTYLPQTNTDLLNPTLQAAGGGLMDLAKGGDFTESPKEPQYGDEDARDEYAGGGDVKRPKARPLIGDEFYKFADDRRDKSLKAAIEQNFAAGGLGAARQALAPRFLSGGGDGMSDSIKANIDGKQEARLADGEFVVPADVVSHLGNGSSKAGAKKLYAMMDKIRQARTGKKQQAPAVNAAKYMPA